MAVLQAVLAGLLQSNSCGQRRGSSTIGWRRYPPRETPASLVPDASQGTNIAVPQEQDAAAITNQLRILQDQIQQLIQDRAEGSSTAGSDTASVTRSLSTMKRDQTRVVYGELYESKTEGVAIILHHLDYFWGPREEGGREPQNGDLFSAWMTDNSQGNTIPVM
ncbi:hypothetical protein B0H14DRAFT_3158900 [Mycena olivaceomarginata]|nr:hypothetical protein B0H14DRAFT_3169143 [Mycena olivaceomarginata]KAJ7794897.1 hypothetical protein B0H14DRAFT_3158900 [Mycena olivaceomarginata]